ncbi:MAG TPA: mechanosensitive ion channel [Hyphomonadaceae bacterium]|nr:mechanosensitive ion channel [Hyphomonadaceae bacterium]HPN04494.1 mechanosensitive ion channel [Hyphomonadaceae bacterium]
MDFQTQFETFRGWAFHFEGTTQKWMWSGIAILVGYVLGSIVSRILRFVAHKLAGLGKHVEGDAQPKTADHVMIDILGALIRACFLLVALAIAANLLFNYSLDTARELAISALKGLAILVGVWFLGSWLGSRVRKFGHKLGRKASSGGETLFNFLAALVRFGAFAVGLIAALQQFGFDTASLLAIVGAAGLAVALALQDTLKAVAAGVVIAVFRPYKIGDNVKIAGEDGTVADITPFTTVLNTVDNREIVITNDKAWGNTIVNSSARSLRRLDLLVSIDYDDDIDKAIEIISSILNDDNRVRDEPPIWVKVVDLAASSVDLRARAWVSNADWWNLRCDTLKNIKQGFDKAGITIPYPHQVTVTKGDPHVEDPKPAAPREAKPKAAG